MTGASETGEQLEIAGEIAETICAVTGYPAAVTLLASEDGGSVTPVAWKADGWTLPDDTGDEPVGGDTAAALAVQNGSALVFGAGGLPPDLLPGWAREYGATSAIVLPVFNGPWLVGAVYALRKDGMTPAEEEVHQAELTVSLGAKMLASATPVTEEQTADVASFLHPGMGGSVRDLIPLSFGEVSLDPVREQIEVSGVSVSLSRTEFIMLYTLAQRNGAVVPHHVLLEACWQNDVPSLGAVDAMVYRLRKKLAHAPGGRDLLRTVRGEGFVMKLPVKREPGS